MSGEEPIAPGRQPSATPSPTPPPAAVVSPGAPDRESRAALPERLWLCVRFPHLALECAGRAQGDGDTPLVVVDGVGAQGVVVDLNGAAQRAGIHCGMGLNAAYALSPWLLTRAFDARRVEVTLERLAAWATRFTSVLSISAPDALLLEVRGSFRLFGGYRRLSARIRQGLQEELGYSAVLSLAPTPQAAVWLGRDRREHAVFYEDKLTSALGTLDLQCLRWPEKTVERLQGMGVRRLADCLRLPRGGFARRFGKARLQALDRALGRVPDPVTPWRAPLAFSTRFELPAPMEATALLEIALERLLGELEGFLIARQAAVRRLRVDLLLENRNVQALTLGLSTPVTDRHYLMDLLRERLDQQRVEAPVLELELHALEVCTQQTGNGDLFDRAPRVEEDAQRLLERLRTRLGERRVHGLAQVADHRPEAAWHSVEPGTRATAPLARQRPLWILRESEPLTVDRRTQGPRRHGVLTLTQGPERIESGWWDGADVRRDYFVARDAQGEQLWVYRDCRSGEWFLQGIFA
ncbi:MAG: DNA polymerase Y family protein [Pseudomonadota bacterium]